MGLPLDWLDKLNPPPGRMLVERLEMPITRGRIIIPDGYRTTTRSAEAYVKAAAPDLQEWLGKKVLLAASVGRAMKFGSRDERTLWLVAPIQIMATINAPDEEGLDINPDLRVHGHMEQIHDEAAEVILDHAFDEGDPQGLR